MLVRKLDTNKVVIIDLRYTPAQEQKFLNVNQNNGYMVVTSLPYSEAYPEYSNYKWENNSIVIDDIENEKQYVRYRVQEHKDYLNQTDFKMTSDYDQDVTEVKVLRAEARTFIRDNE